MGITPFTPPTSEPLSLEEAKLHLRVDDAGDDDLINALIIGMRQHIEKAWDCAIVEQTLDWTLDGFPTGCRSRSSMYYSQSQGGGSRGGVAAIADDRILVCPRPPLIQVEYIAYTKPDGTSTTLPASHYVVDAASERGRIAEAYGFSWPATIAQINAVTVRLSCGNIADEIPETIKAAMKLWIGHLYEKRENSISGTIITTIPFAAENLLIGELGVRYA